MTRLRRAAGLVLGLLAAVVVGPALAAPLRAVCMTDRPLLAAGERAVIIAVTDAPAGAEVQISWSADGGALVPAGGPGETRWSPPAQSHGVFVIRAHVHAGAAEAGETADCSAQIAVIETPNRGGGETLISTRALLPPAAHEAPDYGLYSYVLFAAPPTDQETDLFDAILKSYLTLLRSQDRLERCCPEAFPHPRLNVTYVPVQQAPPGDFHQRELNDQVAWIRNHYDYDRAFAWLTRLRDLPDADPSLRDGAVWIVSCQRPLGGKEDPRPGFQQDLSAVPVRFIERRMRIFASQTMQPRDYNPHSVALLQLDLRIGIAQAAEGLEAVSAAIKTLGGAE
ncbi:hypothetical protein [Roseiarcus sp.]|uniref:hypothetical protein n=1 Tax=Roseiarcus sp. TaxID=1969460 RepID=UPI003F9CB909